MRRFPKISIIIPNYNGDKTIGKSIQSLIDQNYPDLEIIVIDGKSTDKSNEIIKTYIEYIAHWVSEPDTGQSNAINKGMEMATGDILNWLCSDDYLSPGALDKIANEFLNNQDIDVIAGMVCEIYPDLGCNNETGPDDNDILNLPFKNGVRQPACFWRRRIMNRVPLLIEEFKFQMDAELWCYFISQGAKWKNITCLLAYAVQDGNNKTRTADYNYYIEQEKMISTYKPGLKSNTPLWFQLSIGPLSKLYDKTNSLRLRKCISKIIHFIGKVQKSWRNIRGRKTYS